CSSDLARTDAIGQIPIGRGRTAPGRETHQVVAGRGLDTQGAQPIGGRDRTLHVDLLLLVTASLGLVNAHNRLVHEYESGIGVPASGIIDSPDPGSNLAATLPVWTLAAGSVASVAAAA